MAGLRLAATASHRIPLYVFSGQLERRRMLSGRPDEFAGVGIEVCHQNDS